MPKTTAFGGIRICWTRCYACQFGQCPEPHGPHTWGAEDDIEHAAATGQPPPGNCACECAQPTPEQRAAMDAAHSAWIQEHREEIEARRGQPAKADDPKEIAARVAALAKEIIGRTRVEIDPNVRVRGNQTFTGLENCHGPIAVDHEVTVYESEAGIEGRGVITDIDYDKRLVYLRVDWAGLHDMEDRDA